jgi:hypothetical protein
MFFCLLSDSSTLPGFTKFTVSGLLLLLIIYESFGMSGSPFRFPTFGDPLAVQVFPGHILNLLRTRTGFFLNIFRTFPFAFLFYYDLLLH